MTTITTEAFTYNNYLITTSLGERSIYIKIIDKITYVCYESNLDSKEFRVSASIEDIYAIISKSFEEDDSNYSIKFIINSGNLKILFDATIGGFFKIGFEIILREKLMSNDSQLTMNFHRIEQKQKQEIEELQEEHKRVIVVINKQLEIIQQQITFMKEVQQHLYIMLCPYNNIHVIGLNVKISITELTLLLIGHNYSYILYENIQCLYNLTSLSISIQGVDWSTTYFSRIKHHNLLKLTITTTNNPSNFTSLNGIQNFPKLTHLELISCGITDIVKVLTPLKHSIREITIKTCASINQTELMTYCNAKCIKLNMS
jgi:hypothetical protein